jgi:hypothetical protein
MCGPISTAVAAKESIQKIRQICSVKYNSATLPQAVKKCKTLLSNYDRCLCYTLPTILRMESVELSTLALENGKKNCGFCQIKTNTLYDLTKTVPFYVLQRIFPFDILVKNTDAVFMILETRLYELAPKFIQDVIEGLFSPTAGGASALAERDRDLYVIRRLTNVIHKNIERTKKVKKDGIFIVFYKIIEYLKTITSAASSADSASETGELTANVIHIMEAMVEHNLLDQLDRKLVADLVFCNFHLFKLVLTEGFKNQLKKSVVIEQEDWAMNRKLVFQSFEMANVYITSVLVEYDRPICHIDSRLFSFVLQMSSENLSVVMSKMDTNCMISVISNCLYMYSPNRYFDLHVDPKHMLNTAICKGSNLSYTMSQFTHHPHQKPYIVYENENGRLGIDAGGLTRDFYTQYFLQLKEWMVVQDDIFMGFPTALAGGGGGCGVGGVGVGGVGVGANSLARVRFAGVLTAYSMFREKISPNIRFHPLVSYFIVNGSTIHIEELLSFLADTYEIEFAKNLRKVLGYSADEYAEYMDMQGEDPAIPVKEYLKGVIQDRYVCPAMVAFVRGFRDIFIRIENNVDIYAYIRPCIIQDFMVGIDHYRILGVENSLESVLKVDCGDDMSMSAGKKEAIRRVFLEILEELNREDMPRLKALLRFWHGTHGIRDFRHLDLTLRILYGKDDLHGCFSSSTCFGKLYVHNVHLVRRSADAIRETLVGHIERTLENQRLVESAGMYMQMD